MKTLSIMLILLMMFFMSAPVSIAKDQHPEKSVPLTDTQSLRKGDGGASVDTAMLLYFGKVEEEFAEPYVLLDAIERLAQSGDPRAAPALAAVLNRKGVYNTTTPFIGEGRIYSTQSKIVRISLRSPATNAWFKIMWPALSEQKRVEAVLNTISPNPDIHLVLTAQVMEKAKSVSQPLKSAFYKRLLNPKIYYDWRSGWTRNNLIPAMNRLMSAFPPTAAQRQLLLSSPRTLPRLIYLFSSTSPEELQGIHLFSRLMDENKEKHVVLGIASGYAFSVRHKSNDLKNKYRSILLKSGYRLLDDFRKNQIDVWSTGTLFDIADILFKYGKNEETLKFLLALKDFFCTYDPKKRDISDDLLRRALPPNIDAGMQNVDFRINLWEGKPQESN